MKNSHFIEHLFDKIPAKQVSLLWSQHFNFLQFLLDPIYHQLLWLLYTFCLVSIMTQVHHNILKCEVEIVTKALGKMENFNWKLKFNIKIHHIGWIQLQREILIRSVYYMAGDPWAKLAKCQLQGNKSRIIIGSFKPFWFILYLRNLLLLVSPQECVLLSPVLW